MSISHIIVHVMTKDVINNDKVKAELEIHFEAGYSLRGFKYYNPPSWSIPKYYSYISGEKTGVSILDKDSQKMILDKLTAALISVKMVLTNDSYGKSYLVNSKGATLMAQ